MTPDDDVFRNLARAFVNGSPVIADGKGKCLPHRIAKLDTGIMNGGVLQITGER